MSRIALTPNASGTGTLTIAAPNTNTDRTLTLPDAAGTMVLNEGSGIFKIDASGNVGIGLTPSTSDPLTNVSAGLLQVNGNVELRYLGSNSDPAGARYFNIVNTDTTLVADQPLGGIQWVGLDTDNPNSNMASITSYCSGNAGTTGDLRFKIAGTERARIDSSGNLLVGKTTSTGSRFEVERTDSDNAIADFKTNNASGDVIIRSSGGYVRVRATGTNEMAFLTAGTERARIDSGGLFLVGTASGFDNVSSLIAQFQGGVATRINSTASTSQMSFFNPNGRVGFISTSGSATTYSTSSDYRLKENVAPMQNALDTVSQLNPVTYTWKADGSAGQGFIAHELQAVVPDCVTGEKDAVDAEGSPQYQGVDTSFLVATLVKAIQELTARVAELEAK